MKTSTPSSPSRRIMTVAASRSTTPAGSVMSAP